LAIQRQNEELIEKTRQQQFIWEDEDKNIRKSQEERMRRQRDLAEKASIAAMEQEVLSKVGSGSTGEKGLDIHLFSFL
jgi:hypothetical protein